MSHHSTSPLALPFDQALEPSRLLAQFKTAAEHQLRGELTQLLPPAMGGALAGAKFMMDAGVLHVVFEGGIPAGAKLMQSAGKNLPILVDGKRTMKIGRVVSKGRALASTAMNASLIVFEAAHLLSAYDNAQRLKTVERSVDRLTHAHETEMKARMEAVYRFSKELLHHGPDDLTDEDRRELHRQCRDLMELRARWRDDFRRHLSLVERAELGWFSKWMMFWRRDESLKQKVKVKANETFSAVEMVQLMHVSLLLQMTLAGSAAKMVQFRDATLKDECAAWKSLADFGRRRVGEIVGNAEMREFGQFLSALDELVAFWSVQLEVASSKAAEGAEKGDHGTHRKEAADVKSREREKNRQSEHCDSKAEPKRRITMPPIQGCNVSAFAKSNRMTYAVAICELRRLCKEGKLLKKEGTTGTYYVRAKRP